MASSPQARSRSAAYSRTVSSIPTRGSPSAGRLAAAAGSCRAGTASPSSTARPAGGSPGAPAAPAAPHTASAASSVQPPAKTASRRNSACSCGVQQVVAPGNRARIVRCRAGRSCDPPVSTGRRRSRRSSSAAGGSSCSRRPPAPCASGSPSSRAADPRHRRRVLRRHHEAGVDACARCTKSCHRRAPVPAARRVPSCAGVGQGQRRQRVLLLPAQPQGGAARRQHPSPGQAVQQRDQGRPRRQHLLEVVQQQQQMLRPAESCRQALAQRAVAPLSRDAERPGDRGEHQIRVAQRRQVHEGDAVGERVRRGRRPPPGPGASCPRRRGRSASAGGPDPNAARAQTAATSASRPTNGVSGRGSRAGAPAPASRGGPAAEAGCAGSCMPAGCVAVRASGRAAASSGARCSGSRRRAAASSVTLSSRGRRVGLHSRSLTACALRPARSASASWVRPAARRKRLSMSPKVVSVGAAIALAFLFASAPSGQSARCRFHDSAPAQCYSRVVRSRVPGHRAGTTDPHRTEGDRPARDLRGLDLLTDR